MRETPRFTLYEKQPPERRDLAVAKRAGARFDELGLFEIRKPERGTETFVSDEELLPLARRYGEASSKRATKDLAAIMNALTRLCLRYPPQTELVLNKFNHMLQQKYRGIVFGDREKLGIVSTRDYILARQAEHLNEDEARFIVLNDRLDAEHEIDLMEIRGRKNADDQSVIVEEIDLVQVKSSETAVDAEKKLIHQEHQDWLENRWATKEEVEKSRLEKMKLPEFIARQEELFERVATFFVESLDVDAQDHDRIVDIFLDKVLAIHDRTKAARLLQHTRQISLILEQTLAAVMRDPQLHDDSAAEKLRIAIEALKAAEPPVGYDLFDVAKVNSVISVGKRIVDRVPLDTHGAHKTIAHRQSQPRAA